jgi:hypothetical protein
MTMRRNRVHPKAISGVLAPAKVSLTMGAPEQMFNRRSHLAPKREVSALDSRKSVAEAPRVKR